MPKVKYTGLSGTRTITSADFKSVGVEDQDKIHVAGRNLHSNPGGKVPTEVEVSQSAADFLVKSGEFELVETTAPATTATDPAKTTTKPKP